MKLASHLLLGLALMVSASFLLSTCGGGSPSSSTAVPPTTVRPAPAPTPQPTPVPLDFCSIGFGPGNGLGCPVETPTFLPQLETAMDQLVRQKPEIFDLGNASGGGQYKVLSPGQYFIGIIRNLQAMGLCAGYDGEEVWIKNSNTFNDQYNILTSSSYMRRGLGCYRSTCYPAAFPKPEGAPPATPGCSLPPSRELTCNRENPLFLYQVLGAIQKLQQDHPEIFNGNDILNLDAYHQGIVDNLKATGFCARWDGEEIAAKNTSDFSEQYKVDFSSGKIRADEGSYRATCYPAAF